MDFWDMWRMLRLKTQHSETLIPVTDHQESEYTSIRRDYKTNLGWHQVAVNPPAHTGILVLEGITGMNVISPTWFFLSDDDGNFVSIGCF